MHVGPENVVAMEYSSWQFKCFKQCDNRLVDYSDSTENNDDETRICQTDGFTASALSAPAIDFVEDSGSSFGSLVVEVTRNAVVVGDVVDNQLENDTAVLEEHNELSTNRPSYLRSDSTNSDDTLAAPDFVPDSTSQQEETDSISQQTETIGQKRKW
jgi:hypothetical protein